MFKIEDVTHPADLCNNPRHSKRVLQIVGSEEELSELEEILVGLEERMDVLHQFVRAFTGACCW